MTIDGFISGTNYEMDWMKFPWTEGIISYVREITEPVDLTVLVDRAKQTFAERRFLVINTREGVRIAAFTSKDELPAGSQILGQVVLVQIPWLPCMKPT